MKDTGAPNPTTTGSFGAKFCKPLFIISSPRSGSTLLFQAMAQAANVYTVGGESHNLIEAIPGLHPRTRGWSSNRLDETDATPPIIEELSRRFYTSLRNRDGRPPAGRAMMVEKTPKNSLRIPFLAAAYPDARFLYLYREPRETLSSMIEAWTSGGFRTYPNLPAWPNIPWSLLLVPGWRSLGSLGLPEIVAHQWATTTTILLDDLEAIPADRICSISYRDLLAAPQTTISAVCNLLGMDWDRILPSPLPFSPTVVSHPRPDKWRRDEGAIARIWPIVATADERAREAARKYGSRPPF